MTARWVLGGQDPGFPAKEGEKEEIKNLSRGEGGDQDLGGEEHEEVQIKSS